MKIAVIGAAGGLGKGVLESLIKKGIAFNAIVRSKPERIENVPEGSKVFVIESLADTKSLIEAFSNVTAVISAAGATSSSNDSSALLSKNLDSIKESMMQAKVERIVLVNTCAMPLPDSPTFISRYIYDHGQLILYRIFSLFQYVPGHVGKGCTGKVLES